MKNEIQRYLEMDDSKLEGQRKLWFWSVLLSVPAVVMMALLFVYAYIKGLKESTVFLFGLCCVSTGSLHSKQMLKCIEIAQEMKKLKSNK